MRIEKEERSARASAPASGRMGGKAIITIEFERWGGPVSGVQHSEKEKILLGTGKVAFTAENMEVGRSRARNREKQEKVDLFHRKAILEGGKLRGLDLRFCDEKGEGGRETPYTPRIRGGKLVGKKGLPE